MDLPLDPHVKLVGRNEAMACAHVLARALVRSPFLEYLFPSSECSDATVHFAQVRWFFLSLVLYFAQRAQAWAYLEHAKPRDDSSDDGEGGVAMHVRGVVLWEPEEVSPIRLEHAIARADASFLQMIELGMSCHVL